MANFDYPDIFGQGVLASFYPEEGHRKLEINVEDFTKQSLGGQLSETIGASFGHAPTAIQLFYAILMMIVKNQGSTINEKPLQKIFIADGGRGIATGARDGQIRKSFTVSFFLDKGVPATPGIDAFEE